MCSVIDSGPALSDSLLLILSFLRFLTLIFIGHIY